MPAIPPVVDQFGNISVHRREDLVVPVKGDGTSIASLSSKTYYFEILGASGVPLVRKLVGVHPTQTTWKLILVTKEELKKVPAGGAEFVLLDETNGVSIPRWEGYITRRGG